MTLGETPARRAPCVITLLRSWLTNQAIVIMIATSASVRIVSVGKLNIEMFQRCSRNNDDKIAWSSKVWLLGGADGYFFACEVVMSSVSLAGLKERMSKLSCWAFCVAALPRLSRVPRWR